jgi:hypothetical protein
MEKVIGKLKEETGNILGSAGLYIDDMPDIICWDDWVDEDMKDEEIKETAQDVAWEILDNAGLDMDANNQICYGG